MKTNFRFRLDSRKVTGKTPKKFKCPNCSKKSFVRYVDTKNGCQYIDETVGKCDRINHCGYHYTPKEYFDDHPWLKKPEWQIGIPYTPKQPKRIIEVFQPLPSDDIIKSHSPISTFWHWMTTKCKEKLKLSDEDLERVYDDYLLGATRESDIIFWQIDENGLLHTGHIMQYGPEGHRLSYQNWYHSELDKKGELPEKYSLHQCLFGQHLLKKYPNKIVCIVESEKTAIILATLQKDFVWLATCGSSGLSVEKLTCLKGRQVKIIPDSGCYEKWLKKLKLVKDVDYTITDQLEAYPPNTDLADVFLGEAQLIK